MKNSRKKKKRKLKKKTILYLIFFGGIALSVFALIMSFVTVLKYRSAQELYRSAQGIFLTAGESGVAPEGIEDKESGEDISGAEDAAGEDTGAEGKTGKNSGGSESPKKEEKEWYELVTVDMELLDEMYPDTVGWLFFEDGEISYPIMQARDNNYYLRRNYKGEPMNAGSIFLDRTANPDLTDAYMPIYGHNMRDGSMFGGLKKYAEDEEYYEEHKYFQIITADRARRYRIYEWAYISAYEGDVYTAHHRMGEETEKTLKLLSDNASRRVAEPDPGTGNYVLLSTCSEGDDRFVILSYLEDEYVYPSKTLLPQVEEGDG